MKKPFSVYVPVCLIAVLIIVHGCAYVKDSYAGEPGESLNLSRKGLAQIPDDVFDKTELKILRLYGNQIDSISPRIAELVNLEQLYLGKNQLASLPPEIGGLKNLKILSVQYNKLDTLPDEIGNLENLEQLWLDQNQLTYLPETMGSLKKVQVLKVQFNWLDSLPQTIGDCSELRFLYLNRNNLTKLPVSIANLRQLRELHLVNAGSLLDVPEEMCDLRLFELIEIDQTTALPPCMYVLQTNRLRIVRH